jgi:purine nucleosidase
MASRRGIILDTDPGVGIPGIDADDPLALLLALGDPRLELLAVTTIFGNTPPALGARGAAKVLAVAGRPEIPVAAGMATRLDGTLHPIRPFVERRAPSRCPLPKRQLSKSMQWTLSYD